MKNDFFIDQEADGKTGSGWGMKKTGVLEAIDETETTTTDDDEVQYRGIQSTSLSLIES